MPSGESVSTEAFDPANDPVQQRIRVWLDDRAGQPAVLARWLQRLDLPLPTSHEEPYEVLLRALPHDERRHDAVVTLAGRAAALLDTKPDVERTGVRPEQMLYNLLMLCAGLNEPRQLNRPGLDARAR